MSKLSNTDARTIRLAREAIDLVINGAVRKLETQYGPDDNSDRTVAVDALIIHCREEVDGWATRAEQDGGAELSADDTSLESGDDVRPDGTHSTD